MQPVSALDFDTALAMLAWQAELSADEAICDAPVNRYAAPQAPGPAAVTPPAAPAESPAAPATVRARPATDTAPATGTDPVARAREIAAAAPDLAALQAALGAFDLCALKKGARTTVFADGLPGARVMILGEAPGRDEDIQGKPFVGRAGQLLDRMLAAIGLSRAAPDAQGAAYISNILPWRPPHNRDPSPEEIAMMMPFVARHVELAAPQVLVLMGNTPCAAVLGKRGITRLRGQWAEALGRPVLPTFHPAYLLRSPHAKREAWADLLALQARLRAAAPERQAP